MGRCGAAERVGERVASPEAPIVSPVEAAGDQPASGLGEGLWALERRALTVGLVLTTTFIATEALVVITIMPQVARELGGLTLYGWVFSAFMLGSLVGTVAAGARGRPRRSRPPLSRGHAGVRLGARRRRSCALDGRAGGRALHARPRRRCGARDRLR